MEVNEAEIGESDQVFNAYNKSGRSPQRRLSYLQENIQNNFGIFVPNLQVIEDVDQFRYDVKDNRRIQSIAVARVFRKGGRYIFQLGIVNFLEQLIMNFFLVIYCFGREADIFQ